MRAWLAAGVMLVGSRALAQQVEGTSAGASAPESPELLIAEGTQLRIRTAEGTSIRGRLLLSTTESLLLSDTGRERLKLSLRDIQRLDELEHHTRTGALIGLGVGATTLGLYSASLCSGPRFDGSRSTPLPCGLVGALLGGAGGTLVGALVGALLPHWRTRYVQQEGAPPRVRTSLAP